MTSRTVLCPVDFSEASKGAVRYAQLVAGHLGLPLVVMTANDPLLAEAAARASSPEEVERETFALLRQFHKDAIAPGVDAPLAEYRVAIGEPAGSVLEAARAENARVIVMGAQGLTGFRKLFFGSTTERVLRETTVPVLVVPGDDTGPASADEAMAAIRRVLVPVDFGPSSAAAVETAARIAQAAGASLLLLHVLPPLRVAAPANVMAVPAVDRVRSEHAHAELDALAAGSGAETAVVFGDPSEEIAKVALDRDAGLIVIGLQSTPRLGARIGSVTYRVLAAARKPVLALPGARA